MVERKLAPVHSGCGFGTERILQCMLRHDDIRMCSVDYLTRMLLRMGCSEARASSTRVMATQAVLHVVAASLAPVFDGADLSTAPFEAAVDTAEQRGLLIPACGLIRLSAAVSVYFASIDSAMAYAAGLLAAYREVIATADDDFDGLVRTKFRPMRLVVDSGHSSVEQTMTPRAGIRVTGPLGSVQTLTWKPFRTTC